MKYVKASKLLQKALKMMWVQDGESLSKHRFCVTLNRHKTKKCFSNISLSQGVSTKSPSDPLPTCQEAISPF
jgi:hypothetical protein